MIYHILFANSYIDHFILFMRKNRINMSDNHRFVFFTSPKNDLFDSVDCMYANKFLSLLKLFLFSKKADRFILHSYMHPKLYLICFLTFWNLRKITWIIWGGDLYFYRKSKTIRYKCYEFLRKSTIKYFGFIAGVKGDYFLAQEYYRVKGEWLEAVYPLKVDENSHLKERKDSDTINILVGNSADSDNNHIEIFDTLVNFQKYNIKIYTPLSYGGTDAYVTLVEKYGIKLFGEKFIAVKKIMSSTEYNSFLSKMDIMVCNHNRQQALGNLFILLSMGKKIFIRKGITTVELLEEYGICYFFTQDINQMTIHEFLSDSLEGKRKNQKIVRNLYSDNNMLKIWNNIFAKLVL